MLVLVAFALLDLAFSYGHGAGDRAICTSLAVSAPTSEMGLGPRSPRRWCSWRLRTQEMLDNPQVDLMSPKATVLASEKIGKDLFRQVHRGRVL